MQTPDRLKTKEFKDQIVFITGSNHPNGIGYATALEFAYRGEEQELFF